MGENAFFKFLNLESMPLGQKFIFPKFQGFNATKGKTAIDEL